MRGTEVGQSKHTPPTRTSIDGQEKDKSLLIGKRATKKQTKRKAVRGGQGKERRDNRNWRSGTQNQEGRFACGVPRRPGDVSRVPDRQTARRRSKIPSSSSSTPVQPTSQAGKGARRWLAGWRWPWPGPWCRVTSVVSQNAGSGSAPDPWAGWSVEGKGGSVGQVPPSPLWDARPSKASRPAVWRQARLAGKAASYETRPREQLCQTAWRARRMPGLMPLAMGCR
jgi:hypothetical protein